MQIVQTFTWRPLRAYCANGQFSLGNSGSFGFLVGDISHPVYLAALFLPETD